MTPKLCQAGKPVMRLIFLCLLLMVQPVMGASSQVLPLSEVVVYPQHSAPAEVVAKYHSQLSIGVEGIIDAILVDVGDEVKKGEPLVRLNDFGYRQAVRKAKAMLQGTEARIELAEFQLQQAERLAKQSNISEELQRQRKAELASLKAERQQQLAQLDYEQFRLDNAVLYAPFPGLVVNRQAQLGQSASPGVSLIELVGSEGVQVSARLTPQDAQRLPETGQLQLLGGSYPLRRAVVVAMVDPQQRTQEVRLDFTAMPALVGASGRLVWRDSRPHLPSEYLLRREGQLGLILLEKGSPRFVALPFSQEGRAAVLPPEFSLQSQLLIRE